MRRPVVDAEGECLELGEIHARIADKLGLIPEIPETLYAASNENRRKFGEELMSFGMANPQALKNMPFVVAKTLGAELGSVNLANLWALLLAAPREFKKNAARAGFKKGGNVGETIFQAILDHPEGLWIGKSDPEDNFAELSTPDKKVNIFIPEMADWLSEIDVEQEQKALEPNPEYPLILSAGRHIPFNANTLMRNPAWNEGKRACTCIMNPADAESLGLKDADTVKVTTEAGAVEVELEVTDRTCQGYVMIPHGFGLEYQGQTYGVNANFLASSANRDRFAGTPYHRYIPCRVEAAK
jgi:anaerobic selenocysteine-containing dehydrogenase